MTNTGNMQIKSNNLKVIKDQIGYEALMTKKFSQYGQYCEDKQLKGLCAEASQKHKDNFTTLKNYLESHQ
jgi:hypothetical protein